LCPIRGVSLRAAVLATRPGQQKLSWVKVPVLAIFALPKDFGPHKSGEDAACAAYEARSTVENEFRLLSRICGQAQAVVAR